MDHDEREILTRVDARLEKAERELEQVHKFLFGPPYPGARGKDAEKTMAHWLEQMRDGVKAGGFLARSTMYLAGLIAAVGGAWMMIKGWGK